MQANVKTNTNSAQRIQRSQLLRSGAVGFA
jgi:hypothetical protein